MRRLSGKIIRRSCLTTADWEMGRQDRSKVYDPCCHPHHFLVPWDPLHHCWAFIILILTWPGQREGEPDDIATLTSSSWIPDSTWDETGLDFNSSNNSSSPYELTSLLPLPPRTVITLWYHLRDCRTRGFSFYNSLQFKGKGTRDVVIMRASRNTWHFKGFNCVSSFVYL